MDIFNYFTQNPDNEYVIYTRSGCDFCKRLKNLLIIENKSFSEINCDHHITNTQHKERFFYSVKNSIGRDWKTFPIVFTNSMFIGGYTETVKYIERERQTR